MRRKKEMRESGGVGDSRMRQFPGLPNRKCLFSSEVEATRSMKPRSTRHSRNRKWRISEILWISFFLHIVISIFRKVAVKIKPRETKLLHCMCEFSLWAKVSFYSNSFESSVSYQLFQHSIAGNDSIEKNLKYRELNYDENFDYILK